MAQPSPVTLDTNILRFPPPHTTEQTAMVTVQNTAESWCAYKLKTTTPGRFMVRPRKGIVAPKQAVKVNITFVAQQSSEIPKPDRFRLETRLLEVREVQAVQLESQGKRDEALKLLGAAGKPGMSVFDVVCQNSTSAQSSFSMIECHFGDGQPSRGPPAGQARSPPPGSSAAMASVRSMGSPPPSSEPPANRQQLEEDIRQLKGAWQGICDKNEARRKKLRTQVSVPMKLAIPLFILAIFLGNFMQQEIDLLATEEPFRMAARLLAGALGTPLLPDSV